MSGSSLGSIFPCGERQAPQGRAHLQHLSQHDELTKPLGFLSPLAARQEFGLTLLDWTCCLAAACQNHWQLCSHSKHFIASCCSSAHAFQGNTSPPCQCDSGHVSPRGQCSCSLLHSQAHTPCPQSSRALGICCPFACTVSCIFFSTDF